MGGNLASPARSTRQGRYTDFADRRGWMKTIRWNPSGAHRTERCGWPASRALGKVTPAICYRSRSGDLGSNATSEYGRE